MVLPFLLQMIALLAGMIASGVRPFTQEILRNRRSKSNNLPKVWDQLVHVHHPPSTHSPGLQLPLQLEWQPLTTAAAAVRDSEVEHSPPYISASPIVATQYRQQSTTTPTIPTAPLARPSLNPAFEPTKPPAVHPVAELWATHIENPILAIFLFVLIRWSVVLIVHTIRARREAETKTVLPGVHGGTPDPRQRK